MAPLQHRAAAPDRLTWATGAQLAIIYGVPIAIIRLWASRDGWRRLATWPRQYAWDDAQASYLRRCGRDKIDLTA